jgi:hypothetical protein
MAKKLVASPKSAAFRRMEEDVLIQNALGTFFAEKMRAGLLYEVFHASGDTIAGRLAAQHLQLARDTWAAMAERAKGVYRLNIAYGDKDDRRGHWVDRLPAIDLDLQHLYARVEKAGPVTRDAAQALSIATAMQRRVSVACTHEMPRAFSPRRELTLRLSVSAVPVSERPSEITLWYRHLNQAERWVSVTMVAASGLAYEYSAAIPAAYTDSPFPLQYYFAMRREKDAWIYPALGAQLSHQPYFVVQTRNA